MFDPQSLLRQIQALPPRRIAEVEGFIAFLTTREQEEALVQMASDARTPTLTAIWGNADDAAHDAF